MAFKCMPMSGISGMCVALQSTYSLVPRPSSLSILLIINFWRKKERINARAWYILSREQLQGLKGGRKDLIKRGRLTHLFHDAHATFSRSSAMAGQLTASGYHSAVGTCTNKDNSFFLFLCWTTNLKYTVFLPNNQPEKYCI